MIVYPAGGAIRPTAMSAHATSNANLPPRKEKSTPGFNNSADVLKLEVSDSAELRASGAGKNRRKTKPTSIARRRHGHADRPPNFEATRRRVEARRAVLKKTRVPAPKRGDVKAAIFKGAVDATWGYLCASPTLTRDADAFLDSVPFPKKSQPMAKLWPLMDSPVLQE